MRVLRLLIPGLGFALFITATPASEQPAAPEKNEESATVQRVKHRRIRLGGINVSAGYSHHSGYWRPYWYPYGDPWYSPFSYGFYSPFYHPGHYYGFRQQDGMGEVKLRSVDEDASVYLDGAYAGTAKDLKSMWLEPGAYNLEIRSDGTQQFSKRIYVLSGKTLRLDTGGKDPRQ
ncbi:MAG TPA: PEGA domain-containing protein [Bryobacteraceae bacterium]|nr:PEGA domain-containing protein [Bryobacteraceae bacterium]